MSRSDRHLVVWFDGACPLCRREMAWVQRLDWRDRIELIDVTDEQVDCPVDRARLLERFHARQRGQLYSGAAAFAAMWRAIPLLRPFGELARLPPVLALLELSYRGFLRLRPALQHWLTR